MSVSSQAARSHRRTDGGQVKPCFEPVTTTTEGSFCLITVGPSEACVRRDTNVQAFRQVLTSGHERLRAIDDAKEVDVKQPAPVGQQRSPSALVTGEG